MTRKNKNKQKKVTNVNNPAVFLKNIGIKPINDKTGQEVDKIMRKNFGDVAANTYWEKWEKDYRDHLDYCYSDLEQAKLWYGSDFKLTVKIAKLLSEIKVQEGADILDIGGGPGALSFWMSKIWNANEITVADKYSSVGEKWAEEIDVDRVSFIDDTLPTLDKLKGKQYDIIVMSRVIGFMKELDLPSYVESFDYDSYITSDEGIRINSLLDEIAVTIRSLLKPQGRLIVIDSWSSDRVLIVGRAFERNGLFINPDYFSLTEVLIEHSTIVFSAEIPSSVIKDITLGLSTMLSLPQMTFMAKDIAAESIRKLFGYDEIPVWTLEYDSKFEDEGSVKVEILEKDGFALVYKSTTTGNRSLIISPSIFLPKHIDLIGSAEKKRQS